MVRSLRALAAMTLCGAVVALHGCNCGPGTGGTDGGGGNGGSGGAGGSGGSGGGTGGAGGSGAVCNPACVAPQFCSAIGQCIDQNTCRLNPDCPEGKICDTSTNSCVPGSSCGSTEVTGGLAEPNLFISLDRSCSMTEKVGGLTKWQIAVAAINAMTTAYQNRIRFGLAMFPDTVAPSCAQDTIPVPIAAGTEAAIQSLLNAALDAGNVNFPDGPCVTNIDTGMAQAATDPALKDLTRRSFVLLITDGQQSGCTLAGGDNGTTGIIRSLRVDAGVSTFVVGFGGAVDPVQMNIFADEGGVPASTDGGTRYYNAGDQTSLNAALATIGSRTLGCTYNLTQVPPDASKIFVFFDNTTQVARDTTHADGWDYSAATNQVTFYGPKCDALKAGQVNDLDIVFGCALPNIN
jgi:hypothetical protein